MEVHYVEIIIVLAGAIAFMLNHRLSRIERAQRVHWVYILKILIKQGIKIEDSDLDIEITP